MVAEFLKDILAFFGFGSTEQQSKPREGKQRLTNNRSTTQAPVIPQQLSRKLLAAYVSLDQLNSRHRGKDPKIPTPAEVATLLSIRKCVDDLFNHFGLPPEVADFSFNQLSESNPLDEKQRKKILKRYFTLVSTASNPPLNKKAIESLILLKGCEGFFFRFARFLKDKEGTNALTLLALLDIQTELGILIKALRLQ